MSIVVKDYGVTKDGEQIRQYILENANGMKAVVLNYGAVTAELHVPDKDGKLRDVVWGYDSLAGYEVNGPSLGATVGRNANRIGKAEVTIGGKTYELQKNDGGNNLHSGVPAYNKRVWKAVIADDNKVEFSLHSPDGDQGFPGNADLTVSYTLSSGVPAYNKRVWKAVIADDNKVEFSLHSPDGDQGFPGNADLTVSYTLSNDNTFLISYRGTADQDTIFNLTNHSYFNLDGQESDSVLDQIVWIDADDNTFLISYRGTADQDTIFNLTNHSYFNLDGQESDSVLDQIVWIDADAFTPGTAELIPTGEIRSLDNLTNHSYFNLDGQESDSVLDQIVWIDADAFTPGTAELIPTGEIRSLDGTPLDFRTPTRLGDRVDDAYEPLKLAGGYDHNYVMKQAGEYTLCGSLESLESGIRMEVYTDTPGLQLYSANFLEDEKGGKCGRVYGKRSAVCFEAQYFPDAVHHDNFKSTIVKAGEVYESRTGYKFSVNK